MEPHMNLAKSILTGAALVTVLATVACGSGEESVAKAPAQGTAAALEVDVVPVTTQKLEIKQSLPGELVPYESVDIHAKTSGFVKSVSVDRGSRVRKGDLLAELEAPELVAQRSEAEAKLAAAESQLAATQAKLASDQTTHDRLAAAAKTPGVVAGNDVDMAARTVEAAKANVA